MIARSAGEAGNHDMIVHPAGVSENENRPESPFKFVGSSNPTGIMPNKKGPKNQVPFYLVRLGEASVVRKATLCASRTPAGYACGPGENFCFSGVLSLRARIDKSPLARALIFGAPGEIRTPDHLVRSQVLYPAELRAQKHDMKSGDYTRQGRRKKSVITALAPLNEKYIRDFQVAGGAEDWIFEERRYIP